MEEEESKQSKEEEEDFPKVMEGWRRETVEEEKAFRIDVKEADQHGSLDVVSNIEEDEKSKDGADQVEEESREEEKECDKEGICKALYACVARDESELSFEPASIFTKVWQSESRRGFVGTLEGKRGYVPANYVVKLHYYK